jgi:hypothetical protein
VSDLNTLSAFCKGCSAGTPFQSTTVEVILKPELKPAASGVPPSSFPKGRKEEGGTPPGFAQRVLWVPAPVCHGVAEINFSATPLPHHEFAQVEAGLPCLRPYRR